MPIFYENNHVTEESLEERQARIQQVPPEKRLSLFFAWRHNGSLSRDQHGGYHWNYLSSGEGSGPEQHHCTCGLVLRGTAKNVQAPDDFDLDDVQRVRGHRVLPGGVGLSVALIVDFDFDSATQQYDCRAYCQECLAATDWVTNAEAKAFVAEHNKECASA